MSKVAIYARYSSENQRDASIEDQIRICRERAAKEDWAVCDTYTDHGLSGASMMRPGIQALMQDAQSGRFEIILAEAAKKVLIDVSVALTSLAAGRPIRIVGHTDDQPLGELPFADNWGLGAARADRVRAFLIHEGKLDPRHLELATRAFHDPLATNKTPEGRAENRRVEIVVGFERLL